MVNFMDENFSGGDWYNDYKGEVVSLVEQSFLQTVQEFVPWPSSSWSTRIVDLNHRMGKVDSKYTMMYLLSKSGDE